MRPVDVTIVIPVYNRIEDFRATLDGFFHTTRLGLRHEFIVVDDGSTEDVVGNLHPSLPTDYYRLERENVWKNPSRAMNVGLRLARGKVTILCHTGIIPLTHAVEQIFDGVMQEPNAAILARVDENGVEVSGSHRPYFLLGGMHTGHFQALRGYDEDYTEYGYEDDDLAVRLASRGIQFIHRADIRGKHIAHGRHDVFPGMERMRQLHFEKMVKFNKGEIGQERNLNREWGAL
jgi:glycosyltransferase involved in cell wall biosynthesis